MQPSRLLLSTMLLLPTAYGCVQYNGTEYGAGGSYPVDTLVDAEVVDNGKRVCWYSGSLGSDNLYHYTCFQDSYAAIQRNWNGVVEYTTPHGTFTWTADGEELENDIYWTASEYGC